MGTDPTSPDTDGDGMDDWYEFVAGLDPLMGDSAGDPDGDGLTNIEEYENNGYYYTDPHDPDTDGDGLCDGTTIPAGSTCTGLESDQTTDPDTLARLRLIPGAPLGGIGTNTGGDIDYDPIEGGTITITPGTGALYWRSAIPTSLRFCL